MQISFPEYYPSKRLGDVLYVLCHGLAARLAALVDLAERLDVLVCLDVPACYGDVADLDVVPLGFY